MRTRRPTCSPRHRRWCSPAHAALVCEYRDARDAREALRESEACYQLERDDFTDRHPPILFRDWLVDHAHRNRQPEVAA